MSTSETLAILGELSSQQWGLVTSAQARTCLLYTSDAADVSWARRCV